jgi:hypothetical protein
VVLNPVLNQRARLCRRWAEEAVEVAGVGGVVATAVTAGPNDRCLARNRVVEAQSDRRALAEVTSADKRSFRKSVSEHEAFV